MDEKTFHVEDDVVACNGDQISTHPKVFLDLTKTGQTICPYCSRKYIKKS